MKKIVVLSLLVIIGILFFAQIKRGFLSLLILVDSVRPVEKAVMGRFVPPPLVKGVIIASGRKKIHADLYAPKAKGGHVPLLLVHGVNDTGKNDAQLVLLAKNLAMSGFLVLVPDFEGMKNLRIRLSDAEDIARSYLYLSGLKDAKPGGGMMGISYGSGPMLLAAADGRLRDRVSFIATFGGYCDLRQVLLFLMTGYFDYGGRTGYQRPDNSFRWVFMYKNLDLLSSVTDRETLRQIIEKRSRYEITGAGALAKTLGPEGRAVYNFLVNTEQKRFDTLYEALPAPLREYMLALSPVRIIKQLKAYFIIAHGMGDYSIPYTESLRLADAVGDKQRAHVGLLPQFMHIEPVDHSFGNVYRAYILGGRRLFGLIYDLLEKGDA